MNQEESLHFRDEFREARAKALDDAEAFDGLLFALERLGRFLHGGSGNLGQFESALTELALQSPLARAIPDQWRDFHTRFDILYGQLRAARNAALHEGAFARHLTTDAVNIAIVLEDALMASSIRVGDFMVRALVCAAPWQPLSFVRQTLLAHSFSALPVYIDSDEAKGWRLVSDFALADCLKSASFQERNRLLALSLGEAVESGHLKLIAPLVCSPDDLVADVLDKCQGYPVLVASTEPRQLLGIATPFDLL
jgi:hypothetical protein